MSDYLIASIIINDAEHKSIIILIIEAIIHSHCQIPYELRKFEKVYLAETIGCYNCCFLIILEKSVLNIIVI